MTSNTTVEYRLDRDQMENMANAVLEQIEQQAFRDGLIAEKDTLSKNYTVVLASKGVFTRWYETMFLKNIEEKNAVFRVLKNPQPYESDGEE